MIVAVIVPALLSQGLGEVVHVAPHLLLKVS
jgi:hypothetical protein